MLTRKVVEGIQLAGGTILVSNTSLHCILPSVLLQWETPYLVVLWHVCAIRDLEGAHFEVSRHRIRVHVKRFGRKAIQKECNMAGVNNDPIPTCLLSLPQDSSHVC